MKSINRPEKIIKKYFLRKQKGHRDYSLRRLAQQLSVNPSYLSQVFSGKKPFPQNRFLQFIKLLDMDNFAENQLRESILYYQNSIEKHKKVPLTKAKENITLTYANLSEPISTNQYKILEKWYYLPILDWCTCSNFKNDIPSIAKRFKISVSEAREALSYLLGEGFLKDDGDGGFSKVHRNIRFPNKGAHTSILNFHRNMIKKIIEDLNKVNNFDFDERFFNGITLAVDPTKIDEVKLILKEALHKAALVASQGDCTEVYLMNLAYIPLTEVNKD